VGILDENGYFNREGSISTAILQLHPIASQLATTCTTLIILQNVELVIKYHVAGS